MRTNHCAAVHKEGKCVKISVFSAFLAGFGAQKHGIWPITLLYSYQERQSSGYEVEAKNFVP